MISQSFRYRPIVRHLDRLSTAVVLEVGSGPEGLAMFWRGTVIGVDVNFKRRPLHQAISATGNALPFGDKSWPVTVCCDALEHIPQNARRAAVAELKRVTNEALILVFPAGEAASHCYHQLAEILSPKIPDWLGDHLRLGLPDVTSVIGWLNTDDWVVEYSWYESVRVHKFMARWESTLLGGILSYGVARVFGRWLAARLPEPDQRAPFLRVIIVASRLGSAA